MDKPQDGHTLEGQTLEGHTLGGQILEYHSGINPIEWTKPTKDKHQKGPRLYVERDKQENTIFGHTLEFFTPKIKRTLELFFDPKNNFQSF